MKDYLDGFDAKVSTRAMEITGSLDLRVARFQEVMENRTQSLNENFQGHVVEIARVVADGGKESGAGDRRTHRRHRRHP